MISIKQIQLIKDELNMCFFDAQISLLLHEGFRASKIKEYLDIFDESYKFLIRNIKVNLKVTNIEQIKEKVRELLERHELFSELYEDNRIIADIAFKDFDVNEVEPLPDAIQKAD